MKSSTKYFYSASQAKCWKPYGHFLCGWIITGGVESCVRVEKTMLCSAVSLHYNYIAANMIFFFFVVSKITSLECTQGTVNKPSLFWAYWWKNMSSIQQCTIILVWIFNKYRVGCHKMSVSHQTHRHTLTVHTQTRIKYESRNTNITNKQEAGKSLRNLLRESDKE